MPIVPAGQVKTEEVKAWKGVHLLYFDGSLCVRKVQLVLALKGIEYTRAPVSPMNLRTEWYLAGRTRIWGMQNMRSEGSRLAESERGV